MISIDRQSVLFKYVSEKLQNKKQLHFDRPLFTFLEKCIEKGNDLGDFDTLGYFDCITPERVYLCVDKINELALRKRFNPAIVAEIVAIHEISHFVHYHLIGAKFFCAWNRLFLESFAQLLTHKVCQELSDEHYQTFSTMKEGQSTVYTDYCTADKQLGKPIGNLPWGILFDAFVHIEQDPSDAELYERIEEIANNYLHAEYPFWWCGDAFSPEENERLFDLGLNDFPKNCILDFEKKHPNVLVGFINCTSS